MCQRLEKYSSEITKWLKGDHNFTVDTISDIEEVLDIQLLQLGPLKPARINPKHSSNHP